MRYLTTLLLASVLTTPFAALSADEAKSNKAPKARKAAKTVKLTEIKTDNQRDSYAMGVNLAMSIKQSGQDIDPLAFAQAIIDLMTDAEPVMTMQEVQATLTAYRDKRVAEEKKKAEAASAEGVKFLAGKAKEEGVIKTKSGLLYKVIKSGADDGKSPKMGEQVMCDYEGKFIDGTVFDASSKHPQKFPFTVGGVIPGWNEALQMMKEGDKWELYIPYELAYGDRGNPPRIPPYSALVFTVELQEVLGSEK